MASTIIDSSLRKAWFEKPFIHGSEPIIDILKWTDDQLVLKIDVPDYCKINSGPELRMCLKLMLLQGRRRLPIGRICSCWDWKTGCQGHWVVGGDKNEV